MREAYLDIETTGLSASSDRITVAGVLVTRRNDERLVQLVGKEITADNLLEVLDGVNTIFTYNGRRFDLPFIRACLGLDLASEFGHRDLMYDCWRNNLYGGFKAVEQQLGIPRRLTSIGGFEAAMLWWKYVNEGNQSALELLLEYNKEDVMNLRLLRQKLD